MTPEDIDRLYEDAIRRGADPVRLARLREGALKEAGSEQELAHWVGFWNDFDDFVDDIRGSHQGRT